MKDFSYGIIPYIFTNQGISILLSKVSRGSLTYDFIKGKIEQGETPKECCRREVNEEIGIEIDSLDLEELVIQYNRKKDIGLYFINWDKYKYKKLHIDYREIYKVKWFNINQLPMVSKNQRLLITPILNRFNKLNFYTKQQ